MDMMARCRAWCAMPGRRWLHHEMAFGVSAVYTALSRKTAAHDTHTQRALALSKESHGRRRLAHPRASTEVLALSSARALAPCSRRTDVSGLTFSSTTAARLADYRLRDVRAARFTLAASAN